MGHFGFKYSDTDVSKSLCLQTFKRAVEINSREKYRNEAEIISQIINKNHFNCENSERKEANFKIKIIFVVDSEQKNNKKMAYKCPLCPRTRDSIDFLHMHCVAAHGDKEFFTCPWCTLPFGKIQELQKHESSCRKLEEREVKAPREGDIDDFYCQGGECKLCECRFTSEEEATKHYKVQHLKFTYFCDTCGTDFRGSQDLKTHSITCAMMPTLSAGLTKLSVQKSGIDSDLQIENKVPSTCHDNCKAVKENCADASVLDDDDSEVIEYFDKYCMECEINFATFKEFADHLDSEHDEFACPFCEIGFFYPMALSAHFRKKHPEDKHTIYYLGNEFRKSFANRTESNTFQEHVSQISSPFLVDSTLCG